MIVELQLHGRVILRVDVWYLVLSFILRGNPPVKTGLDWQKADLFLCTPTAEGEHRIMIPQPAEFRDDS